MHASLLIWGGSPGQMIGGFWSLGLNFFQQVWLCATMQEPHKSNEGTINIHIIAHIHNKINVYIYTILSAITIYVDGINRNRSKPRVECQ